MLEFYLAFDADRGIYLVRCRSVNADGEEVGDTVHAAYHKFTIARNTVTALNEKAKADE